MEGIAPVLRVANARASVEWYAKLGLEVESEHAFGQAGRCTARSDAVAPVRASPRRRPGGSIGAGVPQIVNAKPGANACLLACGQEHGHLYTSACEVAMDQRFGRSRHPIADPLPCFI
jgi:hypothetical protein